MLTYKNKDRRRKKIRKTAEMPSMKLTVRLSFELDQNFILKLSMYHFY